MTDFEIITRATSNSRPEVKMQQLKLLPADMVVFKSSCGGKRLYCLVRFVKIKDIFCGAICRGLNILFIHDAFMFVCFVLFFVVWFVCLALCFPPKRPRTSI